MYYRAAEISVCYSKEAGSLEGIRESENMGGRGGKQADSQSICCRLVRGETML